MAYLGPKGSVPTHRGWVHRKSGELLKRQKLSSDFIAEWHAREAGVPAPAPAPEPVMQTLHEAPVVEREVTEAEVEWHAPEETDEVESVQTHEPAWWSRS